MINVGNLDIKFKTNTDMTQVVLYSGVTGVPLHDELWYAEKTEISIIMLFNYNPIEFRVKMAGYVRDKKTWLVNKSADCVYDVRVYFSKTFITIYVNGETVYMYCCGEVDYPEIIHPRLVVNNSTTIPYVTNSEIPDVREAVFIDYETMTEGALQTIIQQRPLQIFPAKNRELIFTYDHTYDVWQANRVYSYQHTRKGNQQTSSDGLVYSTDVSMSASFQTGKEVGFVTRLYRMSELDFGATRATGIIQKRALEKMDMVTIRMRLDKRIKIADILYVDAVMSTGKLVRVYVVVEDVSISIASGNSSMQITGRLSHA
jgi:hypothetical protein